jgi:hypothetical protein
MQAVNVGKPVFFQLPEKYMIGLTQERSPVQVSNVKKPLFCPLPLNA